MSIITGPNVEPGIIDALERAIVIAIAQHSEVTLQLLRMALLNETELLNQQEQPKQQRALR